MNNLPLEKPYLKHCDESVQFLTDLNTSQAHQWSPLPYEHMNLPQVQRYVVPFVVGMMKLGIDVV